MQPALPALTARMRAGTLQPILAMNQPSATESRARSLLADHRSEDALALLRSNLDDPACRASLRDWLLSEQNPAEAAELAVTDDPVDHAFRAHLAGDFENAAELARRALQERPDDHHALLHLARALHNLGHATAALAALEKAVQVRPDFAEAWYALAHALRAGGRMNDAMNCYLRAIEQAPGLRQAWLNLGITRFNLDDAQGALTCFEELLDRDPDDLEALIHSGLTLQLAGDLPAARNRLERAVVQAPTDPRAHRFLAAVCNEIGDGETAINELELAIELEPRDPELRAELAGVLELSSRLDEMAETLRQGLALAPGHAGLNLEAARLARRRGQPDQALKRLGAIDPGTLPPRLAQQYFHEASLNLDRLGDADQAIEAMHQANSITAREPRARSVDRSRFFRHVDLVGEWARKQRSGAQASGSEGDDLCFLFGFPRSGTTLLETMLDIHPQAASVEEKPTIESLVELLDRDFGGYPEAIDRLGPSDLEQLRHAYRQRLSAWLPPSDQPRMIVDKMPLRLLEAGFIHRLFPAARMILALRHPCDTVLSNYMQLFDASEAMIHTTSLEGTVRLYDAVMSAWPPIERLVSNRLTRLRYEDLVDSTESELQRLCRFLGLGWDDSLLDPRHRAAGRERVRTASYQQIGEAVYRRAVGRWQRYRSHLEPHLPVLKVHADRFGYELD